MTTDPQIEITRLKFTICEQATEINRLRDKIDRLLSWIRGDSDALTCLQTVYNSSTSSETNKVTLPQNRRKYPHLHDGTCKEPARWQ